MPVVVSPVLVCTASLCLALALAGCNPPDVATPRIRNWLPSGGSASGPAPEAGAGSFVPTAGAAGTPAPAGTGWAGTGGTGAVGAGAGGSPPIGGAGSTGGTGGTGGMVPSREFDAGTDPNRNAVMPGTICDRLAVIQCAGEAFCCDNPGRDPAACQQDIRSSCDSEARVDDIAADPAAAFDPAQAQLVFTELERLASLCDPAIAAYGESYEGLRSMFRGTIEPGGNCRPSNPLNMTMAGAALASCTSHTTHACVPSLTSWTCTPHAGAGGHCFSDINCQPGLYCDNPSFNVSGSDCMQRKAPGSPCAADNECQSLFCRSRSCAAAGDVQAAYCLALAP